MAWVVSIRCGDAATDAVLDALIAVGADDLELAGDGAALGLFHTRDAEGIHARVSAELTRRGIGADVAVAPADTVDWDSVWAPRLRELRVGPLRIRPFRADAPREGSDALVIEVGSAFGSGWHPTTRLCLDALVEHPPRGTALDFGTGTGVLALAAVRLGAERAIGVDSDSASLAIAARNVERNGLTARVRLEEALPPDLRADRVVANVLGAPLVELAVPLSRALAREGELSLSGFPVSQADEVAAAYVHLGLRVVARAEREGWSRLDLRAPW